MHDRLTVFGFIIAFAVCSAPVLADALPLLPVQVLEARRHEAVLQALIASAEAEWRAGEDESIIGVQGSQSAEAMLLLLDDTTYQDGEPEALEWLFDPIPKMKSASTLRAPPLHALPSSWRNDDVPRDGEIVKLVHGMIDRDRGNGEIKVHNLSLGDDAALASLKGRASDRFHLVGGNAARGTIDPAAEGTSTEVRVRTFRPLQNSYYLDWPWVQGEGRNMFFMLFGPPALVLGLVMGLYVVSRAARRGGQS